MLIYSLTHPNWHVKVYPTVAQQWWNLTRIWIGEIKKEKNVETKAYTFWYVSRLFLRNNATKQAVVSLVTTQKISNLKTAGISTKCSFKKRLFFEHRVWSQEISYLLRKYFELLKNIL